MQTNHPPTERIRKVLQHLDSTTYHHLQTSFIIFVSTGGRVLGNLIEVWEFKAGELLETLGEHNTGLDKNTH